MKKKSNRFLLAGLILVALISIGVFGFVEKVSATFLNTKPAACIPDCGDQSCLTGTRPDGCGGTCIGMGPCDTCGDGYCSIFEYCAICPDDCCPTCPGGICGGCNPYCGDTDSFCAGGTYSDGCTADACTGTANCDDCTCDSSSDYCDGVTYDDSCGNDNACTGTGNCDCTCDSDSNYCDGDTYDDSCGNDNACTGTGTGICDNPMSTCEGNFYDNACGNPCPGGRPISYGSWTSCSKNCGGGTRTKQGFCTPSLTETCNTKPCPPGYREVTPW